MGGAEGRTEGMEDEGFALLRLWLNHFDSLVNRRFPALGQRLEMFGANPLLFASLYLFVCLALL